MIWTHRKTVAPFIACCDRILHSLFTLLIIACVNDRALLDLLSEWEWCAWSLWCKNYMDNVAWKSSIWWLKCSIQVQCCFTSTETLRTLRDGSLTPCPTTSTFRGYTGFTVSVCPAVVKLSTSCHNFFSWFIPGLAIFLTLLSRQLHSSADTQTLCIRHIKT